MLGVRFIVLAILGVVSANVHLSKGWKKTVGHRDNYVDVDYFNCLNKADGRNIHPFDCTRFIQCGHGRAFDMACPICDPKTGYCPRTWLQFDRSSQLCKHNDVAGCHIANSPTTTSNLTTHVPKSWKKTTDGRENHYAGIFYVDCLNKTDGLYRHPFTCTRYIECRYERAFDMACPFCDAKTGRCPGRYLQFDISSQKCEYDDVAGCHIGNSPTTAINVTNTEVFYFDCSNKADGLNFHPYDCTRFIQCRKGLAFDKACPICDAKTGRCPRRWLQFGISSQKCEYDDVTGCHYAKPSNVTK